MADLGFHEESVRPVVPEVGPEGDVALGIDEGVAVVGTLEFREVIPGADEWSDLEATPLITILRIDAGRNGQGRQNNGGREDPKCCVHSMYHASVS